ncbi:phage tail protein [Paenibacillus sp. GCM10012303]|uniref:phage tail protein n=1 Tax=Paenibacillus sp. GCM10012303 TaxID=3317340 RepID=UPI0036132AF7
MTSAILTAIGKAKLARATSENQLEITHVAVGDGNGSYPVLTENLVVLANEVWRGTASTPIRDTPAPNTLMFESAIPPDVGGFTIREIAVFDRSGVMIAIGHVDPAQQKPLPTQSTGIPMTVRILILLANAAETNLILQTEKMERQAGKGMGQERPEEPVTHVSRRKLLTAFGMAGAALAAGSIFRGTSTAYGEEGLSVAGTVYEGSNGKGKIPPGIAALVTHNELAGLDMAGAHPASAILDSSGLSQQQVNDCNRCVDSISDMLAIISPENGMRVAVKGYHSPDSFIELNPYKGGGEFVWDAASTSTANGGTVFQASGIATGRWIRLDCSEVTVEMFGSKGDGVYDDRPSFQAAINYLHGRGGGELVVPKPVVEYRWKSYDATNSACLVIPAPTRSIYLDPISIRGTANLTSIKVDLGSGVTIEAAILLKGGGLYKKFENLSIWGGATATAPNCNYVLKGSDTYYPNMAIRQCQFYVAKKDCVRLATYVTLLEQLQTAYSPRGIVVAGPGVNDSGVCTSVTLNSCYALNHTEFGYWFGESTYMTFNSCAADHIINDTGNGVAAYPYYVDIARGVAFNGCGAEGSTRIMKVRVAQGLNINGFMTLSIGNAATPPDHLIRIDGGSSTTISGLWNHNKLGATYVLSLGNTFSSESVTILDQSIFATEVTYSSNWRFENPIRFLLNDFSKKTQDNTLTNTGNATTNTTNLVNLSKLAYDTELVHDVIIRLPSGDYEINGTVYLCNSKTRGVGRVRLIGHADGTSRIVFSGNGGIAFGIPSQLSSVNFTVENVEFHLGPSIQVSNKGVMFYKANVAFTNAKITSNDGAKQYYSAGHATLTLDNNSRIMTPLYGAIEVAYSYKAAAAPTNSTKLPAGTVFKASDPNATRIGWINTADNGASWLPMVVT